MLLDTLHEHLNIGQRPTKAADSCGSGEGTVGGEDGAVSMDCSADDDESDDSSESDFENSEISSTSDETRCPSCPPSTSNVSSTGDGCPTEPTAPNQLCGVSEDSNLSEPSRASTDSGVSDRSCVSRCTPNPENTEAQPGADGHCAVVPSKDVAASASERISSVEDEFKDAAGNGVEGEASEVDGDASERKMPSIEDFCNKDTKTLNTNVLANDYLHEKVSTDSAKYHKTDNKNARLSSAIQDEAMNVCDQLSDLLTCDGGKGTCKLVKDTNLLANCQDKFSDDGGGGGGKKVLFSERDANDECSVNNAKRIKVDEDKKNVRMQAKLKVNTEQNRTKDLLKTKTTGGRLNEDASHSLSSMSEGPSLSVQRSANSAGASRLSEDNCAKKSASHADREWLRYTRENKSIIVDTFQGQFKSTVRCLSIMCVCRAC